MISSEAAPFAKTGGLADVVGSLPPALRSYGDEVAVVIFSKSGVPDYMVGAEVVFILGVWEVLEKVSGDRALGGAKS